MMTKEDWVRLGMHLPWGLVGASLFISDRATGIAAILLMVAYEAFNDWRKHDSSYKDVLGIVWGFLLGSYIIWGLRL